jgi:cytochrome c556
MPPSTSETKVTRQHSCSAFALTLLAGLAVVAPSDVAAQGRGRGGGDETPPALSYRQGVMSSLQAQTGGLRAIVGGDVPYTSHVSLKANTIRDLAMMLSDVFPAGSEGGRAQPEVWSDSADFAEKLAALQSSANHLAEVASGGDLAAVGEALGEVNQTCRGCHTTYRARAN